MLNFRLQDVLGSFEPGSDTYFTGVTDAVLNTSFAANGATRAWPPRRRISCQSSPPTHRRRQPT
jgi:hypothetical protein